MPQLTASRKPSLRVQGQGTGSRVQSRGPGAGDRVPLSSEARLGPCRQGWSWLRPPGRGLDQGGEPPLAHTSVTSSQTPQPRATRPAQDLGQQEAGARGRPTSSPVASRDSPLQEESGSPGACSGRNRGQGDQPHPPKRCWWAVHSCSPMSRASMGPATP